MSDETTLLPCPFCGGEAQVMHMDLDSIEEGWKVWGVWCVDDLNAEDYRNHGHFIDNYATESEAIAAWNARAERGTLTAEQVCETVEKHWHDLPNERDMPEATALPEYSYDWQAIADELNARAERTCRNEHGHCSICGAIMYDAPNYCANCGAKVVDA